jgi:hypothetical protein
MLDLIASARHLLDLIQAAVPPQLSVQPPDFGQRVGKPLLIR